MITSDFYPTPLHVAQKMIAGIDGILGMYILDPSAGKGDILDAISKLRRYGRAENMYAIEINPELRAILSDKHYRVIDFDFLEYDGSGLFDLIIMNPPFDEGAKHLLKAWDISKGALIKCLLNAETIRNPYSAERKRLAALIEAHGSVEFLGQCFKEAERPTEVEVVLVTLQNKEGRAAFQMKYETAKPMDFDFEQMGQNPLAPHDIFESYEGQFKAAVSAFESLLIAQQKLEFYAKGLMGSPDKLNDMVTKALVPNPTRSYNNFISALSQEAWGNIFQKTKLAQVTTSRVSQEIETMQRQQGAMAFTAKNMDALFYTLALSRANIMTECICDAFDELTKYYPENREQVEGWKTNAAYKVGKRFILPNMVSYDHLDYSRIRKLDDLDKAMCFVAGRKFEEILTIGDTYRNYSMAKRSSNLPYGELLASTFFKVRLYKKGTMHFEFRDEFLRQEFNRIVAEKRQWLPQKAKKGAYA